MPTLSPPPIASPSGGTAWLRWFQQLAGILSRLQLTDAGPVIATGAGAPTSALPNGSLYLRTDGGGPNLYVREAGAWVAK